MDDSGFDEVVLPEGTQPARLMAYGPVVGEHHPAAMFGPNRNALRPGDVAASPDYGFNQGDVVDVGDGTLRTVADLSYYQPGVPTSRTIELRNKPDQGRGYVQKVNFDEVVLPDGTKQSAPAPAGFDEVQLPKAAQATPPTDVPTYAPQVVTPDEQVAPDSADDEHDLLYYKTGKTKSEREALNKPLHEAMQVPLVSTDPIKKALEAVGSIGATGPEDLQQGPVQQSINDEIARAISGMTTGEGAASLPLYAFPATAAGLTAENVQELPGQIGETTQKIREGDYPGAASAGTKAALNALMIGGVLHGGAELTGGEPAAAARTVLERRQGILDRKAELTARAANGEQGLEPHLAAVEAELNDTKTNPVVHAPPAESPVRHGEFAKPGNTAGPTLEQAVKSGGTNTARFVRLVDGSEYQVAPFNPITPEGDIALDTGNSVSRDVVSHVLDENRNPIHTVAEPPPPGAGATHFIGGVIPENPRLPIFTTTERTGAEWYARERGTGGQVHEVEIEAKNPLKLFNEQQVHDNLLPVLDEAGVKYKFTPSSKTIGWDLEIPDIAKHSPYYGENHLDVAYIPQVREALVKRGYDSIQASDVLENSEIPTTVLIKDPSQMTRKPPQPGAGAPEIHPRFRIVGSRGRGTHKPTSDYDIVTELSPQEYQHWVTTPEGEYPRLPKDVTDAAQAGHDTFIQVGNRAYKVEPHPVDEGQFVVERVSQNEQAILSGAAKPLPQGAGAPPDYTPEAAAARAAQPEQPVIPPEDVKYAGGGPQTEVPGTVGISQARTEAELGPGSVVPGVGAEMGSGLAHGRDYINKGGDPRLPIRRANTSGMVGKNDVGIVHAELDRLRVERSKAAAALEANPADPVLQQNFSVADDAQRAWRKELQPVLTKASDALREAHAASMPDADVGTYQGLADLMDEHFKGERVVTPEMRTAMAKAARGVKETRDIANGEMAKVEGTLEKQVRARGKKVMTPEELEASIRNRLETEFADCVLGA